MQDHVAIALAKILSSQAHRHIHTHQTQGLIFAYLTEAFLAEDAKQCWLNLIAANAAIFGWMRTFTPDKTPHELAFLAHAGAGDYHDQLARQGMEEEEEHLLDMKAHYDSGGNVDVIPTVFRLHKVGYARSYLSPGGELPELGGFRSAIEV